MQIEIKKKIDEVRLIQGLKKEFPGIEAQIEYRPDGQVMLNLVNVFYAEEIQDVINHYTHPNGVSQESAISLDAINAVIQAHEKPDVIFEEKEMDQGSNVKTEPKADQGSNEKSGQNSIDQRATTAKVVTNTDRLNWLNQINDFLEKIFSDLEEKLSNKIDGVQRSLDDAKDTGEKQRTDWEKSFRAEINQGMKKVADAVNKALKDKDDKIAELDGKITELDKKQGETHEIVEEIRRFMLKLFGKQIQTQEPEKKPEQSQPQEKAGS